MGYPDGMISIRIYHHNCLYTGGDYEMSIEGAVEWAKTKMYLEGYDRAVARFWNKTGEFKDCKICYVRDPALEKADENARSIFFMFEALQTLWCRKFYTMKRILQESGEGKPK